MSDFENMSISSTSGSVQAADASVRGEFIRKTYLHLALAILAFVLVEFVLFATGLAELFTGLVFSTNFAWLIVMALFVGVSYLADRWAENTTSLAIQYAGLALYIVAEAFVFAPLLLIAVLFAPDVLLFASGMTVFLFAGLTTLALTTKTDYSFLRGFLTIGGIVALGTIILGIAFGFTLGLWFSGAMIVFAAASVLYSTSNIVHVYRPDQYVAAALSLFASVALLFYYVLSFSLRFLNRD